MSSNCNSFIFFGRYFSNREEGLDFLLRHSADFNSDTIDEEVPTDLGFQHLPDGRYALGFFLRPGECDTYARNLWAHRVDQYDEHACSHLESHIA